MVKQLESLFNEVNLTQPSQLKTPAYEGGIEPEPGTGLYILPLHTTELPISGSLALGVVATPLELPTGSNLRVALLLNVTSVSLQTCPIPSLNIDETGLVKSDLNMILPDGSEDRLNLPHLISSISVILFRSVMLNASTLSV